MDLEEIRKKLENVFQTVFDDEEIEIGDATTADDIDGWDSLTHVQLIVAVEEAFNCKFSVAETIKLKNVGEFIRLIERKAANA
ncbi:MAG: acyl carrier protein [Lachnospiraceae bacterium]|nr:acyl carrier protein [Lachnospiraceae bacterium]